MRFRDFIFNEVQQIGYQDIQTRNFFGPVYHGSTSANIEQILKSGFRFEIGLPRTGGTSHGFEYQEYAFGYPPPIHFLGYGVYFTTVKNIAKAYNHGTLKGLREFYIDAPRVETINFGSPNTMMKWWRGNGYDVPAIKEISSLPRNEINQIWIKSTENLTDNLKSKFDAVWYKGKGLKSLLDGDQVCVYDPSRIYVFEQTKNDPNQFLVGDRIKIKYVPVGTVITGIRKAGNYFNAFDAYLGSTKSENYFTVNLKPLDLNKIKEFYEDRLYNFLLRSEIFNEIFEIRMKNSGLSKEDSVKSYLDYLFSSLKNNFPQSMIESKVARGQKIK